MIMQHKVLFMIDLPRTTAFEAYKGQVEECIGQLREKSVDVYTRINKELLTGINRYDIVIVIAHRDADETLLLADGKFPMVEFVKSLPTDFSGVLDFSSCYSETVKDAIKSRCPHCHVQVASEQTRLQVRLLAYPYVIDMINSYNMDYRTAYLEVLHMFEEAAAGNPDDENYADDSVRLGEGGQKNTSVFSPLEVKRKATVPIHVFIHYDSEQEVVKNKAPNTEIHINSESLRGVHVGDELTIRLSFIDNGETHHLRIEEPDEFKVRVVEDEIIHHIFEVYVSAEYSSPNFACTINFSKGDEMISCLPVFIDVTDYLTTTSINSQISEESEPTSKSSEHTPNDFAPRKILKELLREPWFKEMRTSEKYNEQWTDDFVNALMESEYKEFIITTWEKKRGKKDHENHYGAQHIKCYILAFLKENKVLKPSFDSIARQWQEHEKLNFDYRSLSRYMSKAKIRKGESDLVSLADWVEIYIKNEK